MATLSSKLVGLDYINGDFTVDTNTLYVQSSTNRVGIGTLTPATALDVVGTITADGLTIDGDATIGGASGGKLSITGQGINAFATTTEPSIYRTGSGGSDIFAAAGHLVIQPRTSAARSVNIATSADGVSTLKRASFADNGDISFYESTGTTAKFFWDASAESLGIGTSTPAYGKLVVYGSNYAVTSSGQATGGIHISGNTAGGAGSYSGGISFGTGTGASAISGVQYTADNDTQGLAFFVHASATGAADSIEAMRLDAVGNLLIGTTTPLAAGITLSANNYIYVRRNDNTAVFDRAGSDGSIADFRKDGISVGNIGTFNGDLVVGTGVVGLRMNDGGTTVAPHRMDTNNVADNAVDLGNAAGRFKDLYLSGAAKIIGSTTGTSSIWLGDTDDNNRGQITYAHTDDSMAFKTNGAERARIDASGNLLVGKTSSFAYSTGVEARGNGLLAASRVSAEPLILNRETTDGTIVTLAKDGTTVGSIASIAGVVTGITLYPAGNIGIRGETNGVMPWANNADRDASVNLGTSTARFRDLWLSGGVYLGGTGAANKLDDYEEGTWTPVITDSAANAYTGTYAGRNGRYTKVGRLVQVTFEMFVGSDLTANGLVGTNTIAISGLPFNNNSANFSGGIVTNAHGINYTGDNIQLEIARSNSTIEIGTLTAGTGSNEGKVTVAQFNNGNRLVYGTIVYEVA